MQKKKKLDGGCSGGGGGGGFYLFLLLALPASFVLLPNAVSGEGIDCFKCVSINGSNPACEDPFHNNYTADLLERPCMGGRKGRNGLFPASSCIKLGGAYSDGSGTIMVRGCALDSGTLTTDTEIIRMSHCGSFYFNDKYVHGCVQSCDDVDACNVGARSWDMKTTQAFYALTSALSISFTLMHSCCIHLF